MRLVHLLCETQSGKLKIYVDMDGVLSDFDRQMRDMYVDLTHELGTNWQKVVRIGEPFWSTMKWMPDGKALWNGLKQYRPTILSRPIHAQSSKNGKKEWIHRELGGVPYIFEKQKQKYAKPNAVLIDDQNDNIKDWRDAGGIGILHVNASTTLRQLRDLMQ